MKKILPFAALLISTILSAQIPTTGLVGYWPFNGDATDYSGSLNNGTINNATLTCDRCGNPNRAYGFNGTNANIVVNNSPSVDMNNSADFSICYWIKTYANATTYGLPISKNVYGSWSGYQFISNNTIDPGYCTTPGQLSFYTASGALQDACANGPVCGGPPGNIENNCYDDWYFIVGVYDAALAQCYIYVNSVVQADIGGISGNLSNSVNLVFGSHPNNLLYFRGVLDDIRLYKTKLTQNDINALYAEPCTVTKIISLEQLSNNIGVFPNPNKGIFTIKLNYVTDKTKLELYNSLGQKILEEKIESIEHKIKNELPTGIYVGKIFENNIVTGIQKIVVTRD